MVGTEAAPADMPNWAVKLFKRVGSLEEHVFGLQLYSAQGQGLAAGIELLTACRATHNPKSEWGMGHKSTFWEPGEQQQSSEYVQAVKCILANTVGLAKDVPDFAAQSEQLMADRGRALHSYTLEGALLKVQEFKERGLMPALQRISSFCHNLLQASDVLLHMYGPPRVMQLAALALRFLQCWLSGDADEEPWGWSAKYSLYSGELTPLRQSSSVLGRDNSEFARLADKMVSEVGKYGPKSPQVLLTGTENENRRYITLSELQHAVQLCRQVQVIASAGVSSNTPTTTSSTSSSSSKLTIFTQDQAVVHAFAAAILDHILPELPVLLQEPRPADGPAKKVGTDPLLPCGRLMAQ
jgi:hypothetical protein